jgi:hypothetical protein
LHTVWPCPYSAQVISWLAHGSFRAAQTALVSLALLSCRGETRRLLWAAEQEPDASVAPFEPNRVVLAEHSTTSLHGGDEGGVFHADRCPGEQVLVGARGSLLPEALGPGKPPWVASIAAVCAELEIAPQDVSTGPIAVLQERGMVSEMTWSQMCPRGQIVVSMVGRSGAALDEISLECAAFDISLAQRRLVPSSGETVALGPVGGAGGNAFADGCPEGQVATGFVLRADEWIDALALSCATPTLVSE